MRDVGEFNLSFTLLFTWAAIARERRLTRAALVAYLVYAVPHLVYHLSHLMGFSPADAVAQTIALLIAVVIPLALLVDVSRPPRSPLVD